MYEYFKKTLCEHRRHQTRLSSNTADVDLKPLDWMDTFAVAAGAKLLAAALTYPHEVLRTRLRQDAGATSRYKGLVQSAALIYREEGLPGLYGGMTAHLLRVVPNACILFGTVEFILAFA
ncbi:mitochondrial carrier domain-containing protein [Chytriomyces sp. MP71]|nr:mitochondrial carrier domain-containing protein [Chytriomyces sp. MP71]